MDPDKALKTGAILKKVEAYYSNKVTRHGPTAQGVDWNSEESQQLRFAQLLKVCDTAAPFSINDYGCGYGALLSYMRGRRLNPEYTGFDLSIDMLSEARKLHKRAAKARFTTRAMDLSVADYTVASGIFNVKLDTPVNEWTIYVVETIENLRALSTRGFAFNALTSYSDRDHMRPDLYYADPGFFFDYCMRHFSRQVTLLHDYGLYEFTLIVRL